MPRFSVIVVYYQGVHSPETFRRGIGSVLGQTFTDYELLIYHDGPLQAPVPEVGGPGRLGRRGTLEVRCTERRFNDWGHSLRDRGIRECTGDYVLLLNADNVLYPNCLAVLDAESRRPPRLLTKKDQLILDTDDILVFPIIYHDLQRYMKVWVRLAAGSGARLIMTGNPPAFGEIDCMQLVMKRKLWLAEGGWKNKEESSDGVMYPDFCRKYGYRGVGQVLGEHF